MTNDGNEGSEIEVVEGQEDGENKVVKRCWLTEIDIENLKRSKLESLRRLRVEIF